MALPVARRMAQAATWASTKHEQWSLLPSIVVQNLAWNFIEPFCFSILLPLKTLNESVLKKSQALKCSVWPKKATDVFSNCDSDSNKILFWALLSTPTCVNLLDLSSKDQSVDPAWFCCVWLFMLLFFYLFKVLGCEKHLAGDDHVLLPKSPFIVMPQAPMMSLLLSFELWTAMGHLVWTFSSPSSPLRSSTSENKETKHLNPHPSISSMAF